MADAETLRQHALALHRAQDLIGAAALIAEARAAAPRDPLIAFMHAQFHYELGHAAADLFADAAGLWPDNPDLKRNHALALHSEGRSAEAQALLEAALSAEPRWLAGHQTLANVLWTSGRAAEATIEFARSARAVQHDPALWLGWFQWHAQAREWEAASAVLNEAEAALGETPALLASRLFIACESGGEAEALLARSTHLGGDGAALCRIRHALRQGDPQRAEALAVPLTATPSAPLFWPYLSLCWRMIGDGRSEWLDRPNALIATRAAVLAGAELTELADLLRQLHTAQAPYPEQSVRGGTQTDRSLLLRHEPILQRTRARLIEAITDYTAALPPFEPDHPTLGIPRDALPIAGSWSVRLIPSGRNVPHSHPKGWLSTAFYVALPEPSELGAAPAGHIAFGTPPEELGLDLSPYRTIAPEPGRLAIFPSTMWHSTVPFEFGERLVIAFDIARPQQESRR